MFADIVCVCVIMVAIYAHFAIIDHDIASMIIMRYYVSHHFIVIFLADDFNQRQLERVFFE